MGLPWIVKDHSLGPARILRVSLMFSLMLSHVSTLTFMLT